MARFKGQPQTQRGLSSSLGDRDKVTDRRQSRFSQNQVASSVFTIADPKIIKTLTVNGGTSLEFTTCFIYLCSNIRKRKNQNKRSREEKGFPIWDCCEFSRFLRWGCRKRVWRSSISGRQWAAWAQKGGAGVEECQVANFCNGLLHSRIVGCFLTWHRLRSAGVTRASLCDFLLLTRQFR